MADIIEKENFLTEWFKKIKKRQHFITHMQLYEKMLQNSKNLKMKLLNVKIDFIQISSVFTKLKKIHIKKQYCFKLRFP